MHLTPTFEPLDYGNVAFESRNSGVLKGDYVWQCGFPCDWYGATASNSVSLRFTSWPVDVLTEGFRGFPQSPQENWATFFPVHYSLA